MRLPEWAAYLANPEVDYITGAGLIIDGGFSVQRNTIRVVVDNKLESTDAMKTQLEEAGDAVRDRESLRLELEQSRRELAACRQRLEELHGLFEVHKKSESLLLGEKNLTEMIARGDSLIEFN